MHSAHVFVLLSVVIELFSLNIGNTHWASFHIWVASFREKYVAT